MSTPPSVRLLILSALHTTTRVHGNYLCTLHMSVHSQFARCVRTSLSRPAVGGVCK